MRNNDQSARSFLRVFDGLVNGLPHLKKVQYMLPKSNSASYRRVDLALIEAWSRSVYDGRIELGVAIPCDDGQWLARDNEGHTLGLFAKEKLAVFAVLPSRRAAR